MHYVISEKRVWEFADTVRPYLNLSRGWSFALITAAYATLMKQDWAPAGGEVDEDVASLISHIVPLGSPLDDALPVRQFSDGELAGIVMLNDWDDGREYASHTTADQVARLVASALGLEGGLSVADLSCGMGSFMRIAVSEYGVTGFYGRDVDFESTVIAKMRASLLEGEIAVERGSLFDGVPGEFDRIFLDGPLGAKPWNVPADSLRAACSAIIGDAPVRSGEWLNALKCMGALAEGGKMAVVMGGGPLFNSSDEKARKALVLGGRVECVVSLPERSIPGTGISPYIVLISEGNEFVRLVDACDLGRRERRHTALSADDIDEIVSRVKGGGERTVDADARELSANGWVLDPKRYVARTDIKGGVPLGSLVTFIGRGGNIPARELDKRITSEWTHYRYLMIGDVEDGEIRDDLPHLTELKAGEERFCLEDGDIVLGKMKPFKSAIVRHWEDETILCTGNLFIIRPDEEAVDPTYLALFLASDLAKSQLRDLCAGTTIPSVPISAIRTLQVPMVSREEQERIAGEYDALRAEIEVHELKIARARDRIAALFSELEGEDHA